MKRTLIATLTLAASFAALPAQAANVTVTLEVGAGHIAVPRPISCPVSVPAGSSGAAVLAKAQSNGCIVEHTIVDRPPYGRFVLSIDHVRGAAEALDATYWSMTVNGGYTSYGIDGYQAANGSRLGFTYTTWLNCLVPETCV